MVAMASEFVVASKRDLVTRVERHRPGAQILGTHPDPPLVSAQAVLEHSDLGERSMHIHTDPPHSTFSSDVH
jgi:hypothetical protein